MSNSELVERLVTAGRSLIATAANSNWRGPDPYDGLYRHWPALLRGGPRRRQVIVQLHARSPVDLRRVQLRRREHPRIAKALALFAQAALTLNVMEPDAELRHRAQWALAILLEDRSAGEAWGYPFDVQTRWSYYPAGSPNVVVTSFAGAALSEASPVLGEKRFAERADAAARWVLAKTFNEELGTFSYHEHSDTVIHNANLLAARLVWSQMRADPTAAEAVRRAVARTLAAQAPDGSWCYGEGPGLEWNDSFHTGFVLGALTELVDVDEAVADALARGAHAYAKLFFGSDGEAWLYPLKRWPEDAHAAGTGLSTLATLSSLGLVDTALLERVATRVVTETVVDGHAVWRRMRFGSIRIPYIRWCDAHVVRGVADAARALTG
jgi:hypothetical protein